MSYLKLLTIGKILFLITGCNFQQPGDNVEKGKAVNDVALDNVPALVDGIWLKASDGFMDGLELEMSGRLHYLNMYSITGSSWYRLKDTLFLSGFTERYPNPDTIAYLMQLKGNDTLLLSLIDAAQKEKLGIPEQYIRWKGNGALSKYAGRWAGVEGTWLEVFPVADSICRLTFRDLDNGLLQTEGLVRNNVLTFKRNGETETLTNGRGSETGMKWLDGRKNCLVILSKTEGYCKDD